MEPQQAISLVRGAGITAEHGQPVKVRDVRLLCDMRWHGFDKSAVPALKHNQFPQSGLAAPVLPTLQLVITDIEVFFFLSSGHKQRSQFMPHTNAYGSAIQASVITASLINHLRLLGCLLSKDAWWSLKKINKKYIVADYGSDAGTGPK